MNNQERLARLHDKWLEPPEPRVARHCDECGEPIYEGDIELVCENGDIIHEDCKIDWLMGNIFFERRIAERK